MLRIKLRSGTVKWQLVLKAWRILHVKTKYRVKSGVPITIRDNGIGMNKADTIEALGP